jgi:hypothetical protein
MRNNLKITHKSKNPSLALGIVLLLWKKKKNYYPKRYTCSVVSHGFNP